MNVKPACDLSNLNFTHTLFDYILGVVEHKLLRNQLAASAATAGSRPRRRRLPQLGPLIMDVASQRQSVIKEVSANRVYN